MGMKPLTNYIVRVHENYNSRLKHGFQLDILSVINIKEHRLRRDGSAANYQYAITVICGILNLNKWFFWNS